MGLGKILKKAAALNPVTAVPMLMGQAAGGGGPLGGIMSKLGLGGQQGEYFQGNNANNPLAQYNQISGGSFGSLADGASNEYAKGGLSLADTLKGAGLSPQDQKAFEQQLATGTTTGSRYATEQVQNNPLLSQLFGKGGSMEGARGEEQRLMNQGFKLTADDHEAYGQASDDIARMFGGQEQSLAQSLAGRGLAAGPSGAAGAQFSGLQGNKMEQLAKAQMSVANLRMQNTTDRLNQTRNYLSQMGNQANTAINDQFGRQQSGLDNLARGAQLQSGQNNAANQSSMLSMQDKRDSKGKTLLDAFGGGLYSSAGALGAAPGKFVSAKAGQAGGAGGGLGGASGGMS